MYMTVNTKLQSALQGTGSDQLKAYYDYVQTLYTFHDKVKNASVQAQVQNAKVNDINGILLAAKNKNEEEKNKKKRLLKNAQYEFRRYENQKQLFKKLSYVSLFILVIIFINRRGIVPKGISTLLIILGGAYFAITLINTVITNQSRHNFEFDVMHRPHLNNVV